MKEAKEEIKLYSKQNKTTQNKNKTTQNKNKANMGCIVTSIRKWRGKRTGTIDEEKKHEIIFSMKMKHDEDRELDNELSRQEGEIAEEIRRIEAEDDVLYRSAIYELKGEFITIQQKRARLRHTMDQRLILMMRFRSQQIQKEATHKMELIKGQAQMLGISDDAYSLDVIDDAEDDMHEAADQFAEILQRQSQFKETTNDILDNMFNQSYDTQGGYKEEREDTVVVAATATATATRANQQHQKGIRNLPLPNTSISMDEMQETTVYPKPKTRKGGYQSLPAMT